MLQIHKRFTGEQVTLLFQGYCQGQLARTDLQELLDIGKSRCLALPRAHRQKPERFTMACRQPAAASGDTDYWLDNFYLIRW